MHRARITILPGVIDNITRILAWDPRRITINKITFNTYIHVQIFYGTVNRYISIKNKDGNII